jgi:predicted nucleotidyltransferase
MRLSNSQQATIREEVHRHFGSGARTLIFGSRVHDDGRGGDIDVYIEVDLSAEEALSRELRLYAALQRRLGEQRIDLVLHRTGTPLRPIDHEAQATGAPL